VSDSYARLIAHSTWIKGIPFDYTLRNIHYDHFASTLVQQQQLLRHHRFSKKVHLGIVIFNCDKARLDHTLESILLQTALNFDVTFIVEKDIDRSHLKEFVSSRVQRDVYTAEIFVGRISFATSVADTIKEKPLPDYICFAKCGDIFEPSFVAIITLECERSLDVADVYIWNECVFDHANNVRILKVVRKPELEPYTFLHYNYVSYTFAVRAALIRDVDQFELLLRNNDAHLFLLPLAMNEKVKWATIPHSLMLRDVLNIRPFREVAAPCLELYKQVVSDQFALRELHNSDAPYSLTPFLDPPSISVIILFRDRPELTEEAILSVLRQEATASLEIVLVNNQSQMETVERLTAFIKKAASTKVSIRLIDYDRPFNHSAQCNLASKEAKGDVLVFFNNDAKFVSPDALAEMAAWAVMPCIGTVGTQLVDAQGRLVAAGIRLRGTLGEAFHSVAEESMDADYASFNRQTWGNSFACTAVSRKTFETVGPLDELEFPSGYNDVQYSARCHRASLVNMYLGTKIVIHSPGTSRGRSDEVYQKILLKRQFPELAHESLFQLGARSSFTKKKQYGYLAVIRRGIRKILCSLSLK
jgi:GT2 family glycosyltransferase